MIEFIGGVILHLLLIGFCLAIFIAGWVDFFDAGGFRSVGCELRGTT